jgi:hypothetical protein
MSSFFAIKKPSADDKKTKTAALRTLVIPQEYFSQEKKAKK